MTRDEFAKMLDRGEMRCEIDDVQKEQARTHGFVVVFGYSDDGVEFKGAINDEAGCYDGGTIHIDAVHECIPQNECDDEECPYFKRQKESMPTIEALWCKEPGLSWTYLTDIPHSTFDILEDGEVWCRGIVFDIKDAWSLHIDNLP